MPRPDAETARVATEILAEVKTLLQKQKNKPKNADLVSIVLAEFFATADQTRGPRRKTHTLQRAVWRAIRIARASLAP